MLGIGWSWRVRAEEDILIALAVRRRLQRSVVQDVCRQLPETRGVAVARQGGDGEKVAGKTRYVVNVRYVYPLDLPRDDVLVPATESTFLRRRQRMTGRSGTYDARFV